MPTYLEISRRADLKWNVWRRIQTISPTKGYSDYWIIVQVYKTLHEAHKFVYGDK